MQSGGDESRSGSLEVDEDEGGGPVKSFLEHLEDLRWVLIKAFSALLVGLVLCLIGGNYMVELLKRPLVQAEFSRPETNQLVSIQFGTNRIGSFVPGTNRFGAVQFGDEPEVVLQLDPIEINGRTLLSVRALTNQVVSLRPQSKVDLQNFGPIEGFYIAIQIAIWGGLSIALPFILYFIGGFVLPALTRKEKKFVFYSLGIGAILFVAGVVFCYAAMLPIALNAAAKYSQWLGFGAELWRARDYIGFIIKFMFGMGISFELPVVILTLVRLGFVSYRTLVRIRPYMVVIVLVVASLLTPPDVVSQLLMSLPLYLLYEISLLIAWYWHRQDQKREAEEAAEEAREAQARRDLAPSVPSAPPHLDFDAGIDPDPHPGDPHDDPHHDPYHNPDHDLHDDAHDRDHGSPESTGTEEDPWHTEDGDPYHPAADAFDNGDQTDPHRTTRTGDPSSPGGDQSSDESKPSDEAAPAPPEAESDQKTDSESDRKDDEGPDRPKPPTTDSGDGKGS